MGEVCVLDLNASGRFAALESTWWEESVVESRGRGVLISILTLIWSYYHGNIFGFFLHLGRVVVLPSVLYTQLPQAFCICMREKGAGEYSGD